MIFILNIKEFPILLHSISTGAQNPVLALVNHSMKRWNIYIYIFL